MPRTFGRRAVLGGVGALLVAACTDEQGTSSTTTTTTGATTTSSGPLDWAAPLTLSTTPDANGLLLPAGFTSRVVAISGQVVAGTAYQWSPFPDGAATFADEEVEGGWYLVSNHEVPADAGGGVSSIRFDPDGEITEAYRIAGGTSLNCAGGATPWGTWLTCEEIEGGRVVECDPTTEGSGEARPALGLFVHEAVCVDPTGEALYLTEDRPDGLFYRFTPASYPDLADGTLEAMVVAPDGTVSWVPVPDPTAATTPIRQQLPDATHFDGGEGIACGETDDGPRIWFSTKGDNSVRELDPAAGTLKVLYAAAGGGNLRGVDNLWWDAPAELLYVAEDGDDMELNVLDLTGRVSPLLRVTGHAASEIAGPTLTPDRSRLYFSSQRGTSGPGMTFEVTGEFPSAV
jgi:secreted PhoX family phosphatase